MLNTLFEYYTYYRRGAGDFVVSKILQYTDGMSQIHYMYNNKPYVYIGEESKFPPKFEPGFSVPIKRAISNAKKDVTNWIKMCAGPKCNLDKLPESKYLLPITRWKLVIEVDNWIRVRVKTDYLLVPDESAYVDIEDILGTIKTSKLHIQ
jgi:hypothetical protein